MNYQRPTCSLRVLLLLFLFSSNFMIWSQAEYHKNTISKKSNVRAMTELIAGFKKEVAVTQQKARSKQQKNSLFKNQKQLDGTIVSLNGIGADGTLLYYTTHLDPTSKVSRANALYSKGDLDLGLSGEGMTVGVWDAGVARTTHQEFGTRVKKSDGGEVDNHGTLVTGAVVSAGVKKKAKGVAYNAQALTHDWSRDKIEVAQAAVEGLLLSNHSYGIKTDRVPDWYFGAYIKVSQDWDNIMYNAPYYLMVTAAGNAQNSFDNESPNFGKTQDGFDLLLGFATSKNGLVISGANAEIDKKGNLKNAEVTGYSSFGPTDDGRIKPDLAGDGTLVYTTSSTSDTSYHSSMGTSMAAPGVTGSLLLLQEYYEALYGDYMKSATLKGLALHSADDVQDPGPDYKMGWGVINTKKAAEIINKKDFSTLISEETLVEGETYSFILKANGMESLSASISWTDPIGEFVNRGELNANKPALSNDLDIRITKNGKTYFPWKLNPSQASSKAIQGDNQVDPFERIDISDAEGEYVVTISHKGNLMKGAQDFSLIVSGAELTTCRLEAPSEIQVIPATENSIALEWTDMGADTLYELQLKSFNEDQWVTHTLWENRFLLENLVIGEEYMVRLRSVCSQNLTSDFSEEIGFVFNGEQTTLEQIGTYSFDGSLAITVFPNPVVNELHIDVELSSYAAYSIISTDGTTLKSGKYEDNINVADLATGLYVLTIQDYSGIQSTKFFKD